MNHLNITIFGIPQSEVDFIIANHSNDSKFPDRAIRFAAKDKATGKKTIIALQKDDAVYAAEVTRFVIAKVAQNEVAHV